MVRDCLVSNKAPVMVKMIRLFLPQITQIWVGTPTLLTSKLTSKSLLRVLQEYTAFRGSLVLHTRAPFQCWTGTPHRNRKVSGCGDPESAERDIMHFQCRPRSS